MKFQEYLKMASFFIVIWFWALVVHLFNLNLFGEWYSLPLVISSALISVLFFVISVTSIVNNTEGKG